MKKIYYIITILVAAAALSSCDKINGSLNRYPIDDVNVETYFSSEAECQLWLDRCYPQYLSTALSGCLYWGDDCVNNDPFSIVEGTRLVTSANTGETAWGWDTMRRINLFLEHADNCKDEEVRNRYIAVARFFRALGYFEKVKRFGDVPYYDFVVSSTDEAALRKPRDPRGYVMQKVMEDLDFAIAYLSDETNVARVTKWSALALKSRAALFEGSWRIYHANDEFAPQNDPEGVDTEYFLNLAADAAQQLIDGKKYSIYSKGEAPYRTLFNSDDACEEEVILAKLYNNTAAELKNMGHSLPYYFTNKSFGFTKRFVNMYLCSDGTRFTDKPGYETAWYLDEVQNRDPRLSQTILCPGYKVVDDTEYTIDDFGSTMTGYKPIKWASRADNNLQNKAIADLAIFRYAEVLLNYAEAKAELGTLTQDDLDKSVNRIRARVGMPALSIDVALDSYMASCYPNYTRSNSAQKAVLLEIRRERVIELVLEGSHLWDMLRWGEGAQMLDNCYPRFGIENITGYFGVYIPGPGLYDMDGDGVKDFEIYTDKKTSGAEIKKSIKMSSLKLVDPENPTNGAPAKGYITAYQSIGYCYRWQENRDYLYPVPQPQINLTEGALTQNPNWY